MLTQHLSYRPRILPPIRILLLVGHHYKRSPRVLDKSIIRWLLLMPVAVMQSGLARYLLARLVSICPILIAIFSTFALRVAMLLSHLVARPDRNLLKAV